MLFKQFSDTEVEKLYIAFVINNNIFWLEVEVNNQWTMCIADGITNLKKDFDSLTERKVVLETVFCDWLTGNVFHREVWTAILREAAIIQARNVWMIQTS